MPTTVNVQGKNGSYDVGNLVAENPRWNLRRCSNDEGEMLFQIAVNANHNVALARNGWALTKLKESSDRTEERYQRKHAELAIATPDTLNYDLGFPELVDSFVFDGQGSRQVNILRFREIVELENVVPLLKIWKDGLRVDLPTSAWILGKLFKVLSFAHDNRFQVNNISGNNVLIQPDQHYVIIFSWSDITVHDSYVPPSIVREEIKLAAKIVIKAVGGDGNIVPPHCHTNDADLPYTRLLHSLATEGMSDTHKAHTIFYDIVNSLCENPDSTWKNGFHEFTTLHI